MLSVCHEDTCNDSFMCYGLKGRQEQREAVIKGLVTHVQNPTEVNWKIQ